MGNWFTGALEAIGGFFLTVARGMIGAFINDFGETLEQTIRLLIRSSLEGEIKFSVAADILRGFVAEQGLEYTERAIRAAIELELFRQKADADEVNWQDKLEGLVDYGMTEALEAVEAVEAGDLTGSDTKRNAAVEKLWADLEAAGKDVLLHEHLLHVLIELALERFERERELAGAIDG